MLMVNGVAISARYSTIAPCDQSVKSAEESVKLRSILCPPDKTSSLKGEVRCPDCLLQHVAAYPRVYSSISDVLPILLQIIAGAIDCRLNHLKVLIALQWSLCMLHASCVSAMM